ncbi:hypothetical protein N658DRAFT_421491 [Parathielavia hyrcaniae]|uniref:RBR-type E3 ubiquitin transferase n=1 Tax=Parathielavia hyrcaniae TaxID=113614 RepID=A0AAN6Q4T2_9PEZI|nr:hypothetical protein N658DRAFT_421491 [Parathielavia hyrcaniae]
MADLDQQQGGPSTSRRRKQPGRSKPQPANDWPRAGEPRSRALPRPRRHGDIDMDIVESLSDNDDDDGDDSNYETKPSPMKQKQRRRRRPQPRGAATSDTASDTTPPIVKASHRSPKGRSKPTRVPNASVPVVIADPVARRPTCIIEEEDDEEEEEEEEEEEDEDVAPSGPSRPVSRQTIARRESSPRSAQRYRSTPESRRSPRTSPSDSEDDTDATSDSEEEQVIQPRGKNLPPAPMAPTVPSAPPANAVPTSLQERLSRRPEMVYEEEEGDAISRYAPSVARHRSLSRPPSSRQDQYRRPRDITVLSGPPSLDETRRRSRSRSKSARPSRRHYDSDVYVPSRPASSFQRPHASSSYSISSSARRSTLFGDVAALPARPSRLEKPTERTTVCALCRDKNTLVSKTVKLKCCHRMCHSCLRRVFELSLTDPQGHMPPRCCTSDNIPPKYVDMLFDSNFKREWVQRYREHTSKSRITCPSRQCGGSVKPDELRREAGRWQGRCNRCRIKICGSCNGRWHHQTDCPLDDGAARLLEQAKRDSWQRCYHCKTPVERKDGVKHAMCHCGAELCLVCGGKWKMCDCSWSKYDAEAGVISSRPNPFASRPASPRELQSDFMPPTTARPRPSSYEDEVYLRRLHGHRDEHLARKMQSFDALADFDRLRDEYDSDDAIDPRDRRRRVGTRDYGAPFEDDEYHRRAATVVAPSPPQIHVPAAPPPPRSAFEPPSRPAFDRAASSFEYGTPAHRSRGMRYASPDRFDGYMVESYPPERRTPRSPDHWHSYPQERRPRSRDRRHTFPSESRPTSPETWQLPTRYPSPEPPMPAAEERGRAASPERRRPPSPERRRTTSLERRLAGRFKESRPNPAAGSVHMGPVGQISAIGAIGAIGTLGPVGPLSPARIPHPPSRAATHIGTGMPMAPAPPPTIHGAPPVVPPLRRHHTMGEEVYAPGGMPSPADWFGPPLPHGHPHTHPHARPPPLAPHPHVPPPGLGMMPHHGPLPPMPGMHDMMMDMNGGGGGSPRGPQVKRRPPQAHREHNRYEVPRSSVLAGLGGMGRGMHRVSEWVHYVEPGMPDGGDAAATVVQ